jgi:TolB-like protein/Flp pilus assembly protein TadD
MMQIWSSEIKELETLNTSIKGRFPELEKELERLVKADDENMVLLYSRRCLEVIITDLCESELKRPRKTEPLKGIIDKLQREEKVPSHIIVSMQYLNSLSSFGAHPKEFDPEQVRPVLINLITIIKWYLKYKDTQSIDKTKVEEEKHGIKEPVDTRENIHKPKKKLVLFLSGLLMAMVLVVVALFVIRIIGGKKESKELEKSIAVLPFLNDSPDEENTYFINGIMDEILINLQTIKELRVISRTSVEKYRGPEKPSIPEIAKELGVNYIVEGSGQKYGNTISLRVQLLRAAKEGHLWGESYEQEINEVDDILSIQRQIAESIAKELKAVITPQEEDLIQQIPTNNPLAYDYYLKGRQYNSDLKWNLAIDMFSKAIEQDPGFALAYLARASLCSRLYFTKGLEYRLSGTWEGYDSLAKVDLNMAMKISPDLPEVKYAQAEQLYRFDRKNDEALRLLDEVKILMSNNHSFFLLRSAILRRKGQWEESLMDSQKSILLDPLNPEGYIEIAHTYRMLRKYAEAMEFYNKSQLLNVNPENQSGRFLTILLWKGDVQEALRVQELTDFGSYGYFVPGVNYYLRQYDRLIAIADKVESQFIYFPKTLNLAWAYLLNSNIPLCSQYADSAIDELNLKIKEFPEDDRFYAALGYAWAFKGENKKAIENAQKAVKLKPLKLDAWQGFMKELDLLRIYILTGEYDLAMDKIESLLTIPGDLAVPLLKIDPTYDQLRELPRFQKILATEYKTNY